MASLEVTNKTYYNYCRFNHHEIVLGFFSIYFQSTKNATDFIRTKNRYTIIIKNLQLLICFYNMNCVRICSECVHNSHKAHIGDRFPLLLMKS